MSKLKSLIVLIFLGGILSACQTAGPLVHKNADFTSKSPRVLLMPLDVQLSELTAGGLLEPNAEWTALAEDFMGEELREKLDGSGTELMIYDGAASTIEDAEVEQQLIKLHEMVGRNIALNRDISPFAIPTKKGVFEWSLGEKATLLRDKYDADYAMFVFVRDSYASAGRVAVKILAAIFKVQVSTGVQEGFASLVDLKTGDVVWYNLLVRQAGDLREQDKAAETMNELIGELPI